MGCASYELNMNRNFGMNAKVWRSKQINRSLLKHPWMLPEFSREAIGARGCAHTAYARTSSSQNFLLEKAMTALPPLNPRTAVPRDRISQ